MKKRYLYSLLFVVPGFFVTLLVVVFFFGVVYGALWLFVYGDDSWPAWTEQALSIVIAASFCILWLGTAVAGYITGKRLESTPGLDTRHIWISVGATLLPIVIMALHQLSVGNLGPKSDVSRCIEYCSEVGFDTSGMGPADSGQRVCQCFGPNGDVEATVPINELGGQY